MGVKPCSIGTQKERARSVSYYILEKERKEECKESKLNLKKYDTRYRETGFKYNIGQMHDEMGVFLELGRHPFNVRGLRDKRRRSGDNLSIFIRPTIPYSISCDGEKSRKSFLD